MAISFHSDHIHFQLKEKLKHKRWIRQYLGEFQRNPGQLNFIFTSNEHIRLMNREFLNHNYYTDVITFDYTEDKLTSGDVFISIDQVKINAVKYSVDVAEELRRVMIHGVLHLVGFMDVTEEEKEIMQKKENEALHLWLKVA